jgi:hypothetical protein
MTDNRVLFYTDNFSYYRCLPVCSSGLLSDYGCHLGNGRWLSKSTLQILNRCSRSISRVYRSEDAKRKLTSCWYPISSKMAAVNQFTLYHSQSVLIAALVTSAIQRRRLRNLMVHRLNEHMAAWLCHIDHSDGQFYHTGGIGLGQLVKMSSNH